jgi:hypothetical protein
MSRNNGNALLRLKLYAIDKGLCRLLDLNDIDIGQRLTCKQKRSEFVPQAPVGLNWTIKFRLLGLSLASYLMPDQFPPRSITYTRRSPHQTLTLAAVPVNLRACKTACPSSRQLGNVISSVHFPSCSINRTTYSTMVVVDRGRTRSRQLSGVSRIILKSCFMRARRSAGVSPLPLSVRIQTGFWRKRLIEPLLELTPVCTIRHRRVNFP